MFRIFGDLPKKIRNWVIILIILSFIVGASAVGHGLGEILNHISTIWNTAKQTSGH